MVMFVRDGLLDTNTTAVVTRNVHSLTYANRARMLPSHWGRAAITALEAKNHQAN